MARNTFPSQNRKSTPGSEHFWKFISCAKSARRSGAEHVQQHNAKNDSASEHFWKFSGCESAHVSGAERISKSEALHSRSTFLEVKLLKKCMASVAGSEFRNQHGKNITCPLTFERSSIVFQGRRNGACAFKSGPNVWFFVAVSKTSRCSAFERICKDAFRMAGAAQETSPSNMLGGQGADLLAMVALWSIR